MTLEERNILIMTCLLRTNYSEDYLEKLTDSELEEFYDKHVGRAFQEMVRVKL